MAGVILLGCCPWGHGFKRDLLSSKSRRGPFNSAYLSFHNACFSGNSLPYVALYRMDCECRLHGHVFKRRKYRSRACSPWAFNQLFLWKEDKCSVKEIFPAISAAAIVIIIAVIIGTNSENLARSGPLVLLAVILHNGLGLAGGYWVSKALKLSEIEARTIASDHNGYSC
jgi:bile acid:Na+ symporter, BASS family